MMTFTYEVEGLNTDPIEFETVWGEGDLTYVAEDAAKHYFDHHNGYQCTWPMDFKLSRMGDVLATFSVDVIPEPTFEATLKND